ncbi:MAG: redoxin domain-containing protein [candidate division Zixibacteria bacterium]|nr:redoxin domain-containing protein [candidate division Zixibacteria bacterium]
MRINYVSAITAIVLLVATIGVMAADPPVGIEQNRSALINERAPEINLPGVAGTNRSLADFKGKYVVLEWVDFTCPFVRKHYDSKNIQNLQADLRQQGVVWLSISSVRSGADGYLSGKTLRLALAKEKSEAADYLTDSTGAAQRLFGVTITPTVVLIDPDGVVRYFGAIDDQPTDNPANIAKATNHLRAAFEAEKSKLHPNPNGTLAYGCPAPTIGRAEH